ncbi:Meckel syndrome type 1 protein like [Schistosoma japonicum]|nr:Meckel syndrome type 1 protein like [Schistosoma japonicum]
MYIMADLSDSIPGDVAELSSPYVGNEEILCKITIGSDGLLHCKPDFTHGSDKYKIESKQKGSYYYTLENISIQMSEIDKQTIRNIDKEQLSLRKSSQLCAIVGKQFEMNRVSDYLSLGKYVSYLLIVISVGATDFENSGLYVQYFLELPQNWKAYDHKLLCGSSQIASITNHGNKEISTFSHPIEFDLTYKPEINIGTHSVSVSCWRPVGDSVVEDLRRFFTGGTCQLEDPTFSKIPGSFEVSMRINTPSNNLVKYGFRTRSTGKLFLRLNCAIQSWSNLYKIMSECPTVGDEKQRKIALAHMDVSTIIKAYQKARFKLLETRKVIEGLRKSNS